MSAELVPEATQIAAGKRLGFTLVNHGPGSSSCGQFYGVQREEAGDWTDATWSHPVRRSPWRRPSPRHISSRSPFASTSHRAIPRRRTDHRCQRHDQRGL